MLDAIHQIAVLLGLSGAAFLAAKRPLTCQLIWLPANALWVTYAWARDDWWTVALFTGYFALTTLGIWRWSRKDRDGRDQ